MRNCSSKLNFSYREKNNVKIQKTAAASPLKSLRNWQENNWEEVSL